MKLLSFECKRSEVIEKRKWIEQDLGLGIFKINYGYYSNHTYGDNTIEIVFIVHSEETENFLRLKYPKGTFKDLSI